MRILGLTLSLLLLAANAERDFNANESQVPVIEPQDAPAYKQHPYVTELMRCQQSQPELVLSLLLRKHDWHEESSTKRAYVQAKLAKFFAIPQEFISLDTVGKRELSSMHKLALRKGGKGQKELDAPHKRLGRASFTIGCGSNYFSMGEPIAKQIGHQLKDGTIGALAEENFGLWFIWRKELKSRSQRKRRQSEGSGGDEDEYDYGDYEDTPEPVTEVPTTHAHRHHHGVNKEEAQQAVDSLPSVAPANKLDEEIKESVSELESVISKTIENTKNIKELPVLSAEEDAADVDDVELQQLGVPAAPIIEERANELANGLELKANIVEQQQQSIYTTTLAPGSSYTLATVKAEDAANNNNNNNNNNNQFNTAAVAVDVNEHTPTPSTTQTTTNHNNSNNNNNNNTPLTPVTTSVSSEASSSVSNSYTHTSIASIIETAEASAVDPSYPSATLTPSSSSSNSSSSTSSSAGSSTESVIDTDMANTHATTTAATTAIETTTATYSSSSSSASSTPTSFLHASSTTTTTTIATMPTTTATTTTTTLSQTPKVADDNDAAVDALEAASNSSVPNLASNELSSTIGSTTTTTSSTTQVPAVELSSSTYASTDYVEPEPKQPETAENSLPIIKSRLQKFAVTSGKAFRYEVPSDTFYDAEDQTNLRLQLADKDGHELKPTSWLQFNADKRELYGLPLDDAVSRWEYKLSATDSANNSVAEMVDISVQQHRAVRTINHEIIIDVVITEPLSHNIDWQLKLMDAVAKTLENGDNHALVVREIRQTQLKPLSASFVYFNETLPTSDCPKQELNEIVDILNAARLIELVKPLLSIKMISGQLIGACQKTELVNKVKPTTTQVAKKVPPMPRNQVDRVNASVGQLLVYKVPSDTFFDADDTELSLTLKTKDNRNLSSRHWLQFDSKNQEFFGIPKPGDSGAEEYLLVAEDSDGLSANDALVVVVNHPAKRDYAIYFKAYLALRHEQFTPELQRRFVERVAQLNGDANTKQVLIKSIIPQHDSDGTIVNFYNASLYKSHNRCPDRAMAAARSVYLNSDLTPHADLRKAFGAELNLTNFSVVAAGICSHMDGSLNEFGPPRSKDPSAKPTFPEEYLATFILPAVIIIAMILLASIIACCLHRRRHKSGKMELGDEEERKSFRTKGIPVIFQDEFEEKPEIGNKSPVILKDEKPPLLPPSYNTSNMNGDNDVDEYVPPPAVVLGGREVRGKSPATPSYRKPPPYVSP
ncbi:uncharacterized protein LOC108596746 isoform X2 [Drosophila busckii]|uniref:uncharacterized protein LOC108596746 isoform X2 n=1 Tax=Drosophila busckii TaxID=30019 RepID=UPI00083F1571|nr:uncharacterized protein LOC108596746 isoform X2 [Drosophila busckii]